MSWIDGFMINGANVDGAYVDSPSKISRCWCQGSLIATWCSNFDCAVTPPKISRCWCQGWFYEGSRRLQRLVSSTMVWLLTAAPCHCLKLSCQRVNMSVDTIDYFYQDIAMVGWWIALIVETTKVNHNDRGCLLYDVIWWWWVLFTALSFKMWHHRILWLATLSSLHPSYLHTCVRY